MSIDFGVHGYDFMRDLCAAIEQYTELATQNDSSAYLYRGLELRYAIERQLYFQCINSEPLFYCYLATRKGVKKEQAFPTLTSLEGDVALFLCSGFVKNNCFYIQILNWLAKVYDVLIWGLRRWRQKIRMPNSMSQKKNLLISVISKKFANYLVPVTQRLPSGSFAYLATTNFGLRDQLVQAGYPVVGVKTDGSIRSHLCCSKALSKFVNLMHDADATLTAVRELRPKCVVVVEGNAPQDILMSEAARQYGIPCYCIQQGWSPYVHTGFRNMNYTEMFVWGRRFAESLMPYNPNMTFRATGNHALRMANKKIGGGNLNTISFFLQAPSALLGVKAFDSFIGLVSDVAQAHPELRIIVREHPGYSISENVRGVLANLSNVRFSIPEQEALVDVISVSDLAVSVFSTVLLEAMAMNVVPLICSIGAISRYEPRISDECAAFEVQSVEEARRLIDELVKEPQRLNAIKKSMHEVSPEFFNSDDAAATIVKLLIQGGECAVRERHSC